MPTNFWLIRHAIVAENERATLYGVRDVQLCPDSLVAQVPMYQALAARLPRPATWLCTPLSRTRRTAEAIFKAGYPAQDLAVEPDLIEKDLGDYQGLRHAALPPLLSAPAHPFWPLAAGEQPPNGESFAAVLVRVGAALERLAEQHDGRDVVVVSHGGAIRAAVAHAMDIDARRSLHLSVYNLSLTRLERLPEGWRVASVNESPGFEDQIG
jgi:alpha-ribazole phosphatase